MTRRDMIIVAVLANIGVLAILFMLAFRTEDDKAKEGGQIAYTLTDEPAMHAQTPIEVKPSAELIDVVETALKEDVDDENPHSNNADDENFQLVEPDAPQAPVKVEEATPVAAEAQAKFVDITIKRGDALEKIARANGTTVEAIMKENNLKNDRLRIGQVLKIPVGAGAKKVTSSSKPSSSSPKQVAQADAEYYTIKSGDNPWKIAKQYHLKLDELLKLNNLNEEKARNLKVGDTIRVK